MGNKETKRIIKKMVNYYCTVIIFIFLHTSFVLSNETNDETNNTLNITATMETNATTTALQPMAEPLVRYRRHPTRKIIKHIIRPKRVKMKRAKRPKIKYSFAEPPTTYYHSRPRYKSHKAPTFDSPILEDFSHYNVESADFDLPPSSYEAQSMDLDLYKHYEAPAESEYKEIHEYAGPEVSYKEPEITYEEIKKPSYSYSLPETTYKEPEKTYTYIPSQSSETRKPHTKYGIPTEFVYSTDYDKTSDNKYEPATSFKPSKPIYTEIEQPSYSSPPSKEEYSYSTHNEAPPHPPPPRIPATKYGVPDVHIPVTGINDYNKYSVFEQKPSYTSYTPTKSDKYNFAEPPQPEPNVEITYSPSYEINIPSSHENKYSSGGSNKYNVQQHQSSSGYEEPTQQYHPQPPSYDDAPQQYEHHPGYQESSDTNHQPPVYHPAPPPDHGSITEYIPQSQDLPIDVNHKQPPYNYPKSSYEVPIYDPIPFDSSNNQEHEVYPPQTSKSNNQPESEETPSGDAHSSGTRPLPQSTSQRPESPINRLRKTRKRKRNRGSSTTVSTTKHILDVPELEQAFQNEKRNQFIKQDTELDADESNKIQNINFLGGAWNPMKIRTSPKMTTTQSTVAPLNMSTNNGVKRHNYKQRSTTTTTTTQAPLMQENIIPKSEIISIQKSTSKSYYDGILSTPRVYNVNSFRNRYKNENPTTTVLPLSPQKVTTNENKFSKRTTKNIFDTTVFKSPLNDRDLYRNLPKNHKLF